MLPEQSPAVLHDSHALLPEAKNRESSEKGVDLTMMREIEQIKECMAVFAKQTVELRSELRSVVEKMQQPKHISFSEERAVSDFMLNIQQDPITT